jgi:hypothetical protein
VAEGAASEGRIEELNSSDSVGRCGRKSEEKLGSVHIVEEDRIRL